MKNYKKYIIFLTLVSLPVFAHAGNPPKGEVWLFLANNYKGEPHYKSSKDIPELPKNFEGKDFQGQVSSVKVGPHTKVILYEEINYGGEHVTIEHNTPILANANKPFNDRARSLKVQKKE